MCRLDGKAGEFLQGASKAVREQTQAGDGHRGVDDRDETKAGTSVGRARGCSCHGDAKPGADQRENFLDPTRD